MQLLELLLPKLKAAGHRVLVFSQMTRMLDVLEDYLLARGHGFERLDGNVGSAERQLRIDRFNRDMGSKAKEKFVFLLSTPNPNPNPNPNPHPNPNPNPSPSPNPGRTTRRRTRWARCTTTARACAPTRSRRAALAALGLHRRPTPRPTLEPTSKPLA